MKCPQCQRENRQGATFCGKCGADWEERENKTVIEGVFDGH